MIPWELIWWPTWLLSDQRAGSMYWVERLDKGWVMYWAGWGGWCEISSQYSEQQEILNLWIACFWNFHLIFWDHNWLWVTETVERETTDKGMGGYLYFQLKQQKNWGTLLTFGGLSNACFFMPYGQTLHLDQVLTGHGRKCEVRGGKGGAMGKKSSLCWMKNI